MLDKLSSKMEFKILLTFSCLLYFCGLTGIVLAVDPVLSPTTLSDGNGNSADGNSDITWANIPSYASYSAGDITYNSNGLGPLFNFAKSFINNAVFPYGLPWDLIEKTINGTIITDVTTNYMSYLQQFGGYGACIIIGFLFFFIFPIVGLCFCCCRCCCNNCGGKMEQSSKDAQATCKRRVFGCILLVLVAFTLAGNICVFVTNDQMSFALENIDDAVTKNLDDVSSYVNNSIDQIKYIANDNFNFTLNVVYRDLDNIAYIMGVPLRDNLNSAAGVGAAINTGYALETRVSNIGTSLLAVNTTLADVKSKADILSSNLTSLKNDIDTTCTSPCSIDTSGVALGFSTSDFPDISDPVNKISEVQSQNLTAVIVLAQKEFDEIPWRVHNESISAVSSLKGMIANYSGQLDSLIDQMVSAQGELGGNSLGNIKSQVSDFVSTATTFDSYRYLGGIALGCIVLLVVVLQFFGLAFGVLSHKNAVSPTKRSCVGTMGGNMLMASVGFVFIFSSLLMLLTTLTFIFGAPMEKFVCNTLTSSNMDDLEELVDDKIFKFMYPDKTSGTLLGVSLFSNDTIDLKFTTLLKDCQAGAAAYKALKLDNLFDITKFTNYSNKLDVNSEIDNIKNNIDLSTIELLTTDLVTQLNNLKDSINVNFTQFRSQLNKNASGQDLGALASELQTAGDTASGIIKTNLYALRDRTVDINNTAYLNLLNSMTQLQADLDALEAAVNGTDTDVDAVINSFNATQEYLRNNASTLIAAEARTYADRIFKVVDSYIADAVYALNNEIGTCEPIWNLYNSLIVITFCKYTIDTLNGFWFGLGWCIFFFVPSIIFATKLAKHYRKMKSQDYNENNSFSSDKRELLSMPEVHRDEEIKLDDKVRNDSFNLAGKNNKVGHHDPAPPPYESNSAW